MITFSRLTYHYPGQARPALRDIDLRINAGEFVLLTGPSGAGKSTLLRCLNGLVPHFTGGRISGGVTVAGLDVVAAGPNRLSREVGFVFQNPEAQAVLDQVEAEIAFGLEQANMPASQMRQRVTDVMDRLALTPLRRRAINTLSGGERQRLALATALALRPRILALDEPTSQLDPEAAANLLDMLVRLNRDDGLTVVLVEHRLERVLPYADRVVVVDDGRIVADGPVLETLDDLPYLPPVTALGRRMGWQPPPLTVDEARAFAPMPALPPPPAPPTPTSTSTSAPLLEVDQLACTLARQPVLRDISLTVGAGEVVALLGRNGAGKTTLLRCVAGLLPLAAGAVRLDGDDLAGRSVAERCRHIAYLPQNPDDLLYAGSVREELLITLRNHRLDPAHPPILPAGLLAHLGLGDVQDAYPRDLSVGQRQRVAFGAVSVTGPRLLLLDEPTRGLDMAAKQQLLHMCRWWLDDGAGLLLVTHDVELAAAAADRVYILDAGQIVAAGPPGQVLATHPEFAPQMVQLFPGQGWLTPDQAAAAFILHHSHAGVSHASTN